MTGATRAGAGDRDRDRPALVSLLPGAVWLSVFFLVPLAGILVTSFLAARPGGGVDPTPSVEAWRLLREPVYARVLWRSVGYAAAATGLCLAFGYPIAVLLARLTGRARNVLLLLLLVPLWMSFLLKAYAWMHLLGDEGLLNRGLAALGLVDEPVRILYTPASVLLGYVAGYLPFMVLPIYVSLERLDPDLVDAAMDLGASRLYAFIHVTTRLALPGILAGSVLVFVPTLGEFVIPDVLGGGKVYLLGNLVKDQYLGTTPHWPLGAALAAVTIAVALAAVLATQAAGRRARVRVRASAEAEEAEEARHAA